MLLEDNFDKICKFLCMDVVHICDTPLQESGDCVLATNYNQGVNSPAMHTAHDLSLVGTTIEEPQPVPLLLSLLLSFA